MKYSCFTKEFEKFDNCDHFFIICGDDYDWYEGTHDFDYGCIKCGLTNRCEGYDPPSEAYLKAGHKLKGFLSKKLEFSFGPDGSLQLGYERAKKLYKQLTDLYGKMSNEKLCELLKEESEKIYFRETGLQRRRKPWEE